MNPSILNRLQRIRGMGGAALFAVMVLTAALLPAASGPAPKVEIARITGQKIWDLSRISDRPVARMELTDLIRFKGNWYCGFHEGEIHGNHPSGRARIIRSADGEKWETVALLTWDSGDVREPRFSITAEGQLMVNTSVCFVLKNPVPGGSLYPIPRSVPGGPPPAVAGDSDLEAGVSRQSVTWLSANGTNWSSGYACPTGVNTWRWDVTWHNGMGYSVGYSGKDDKGTLYRTRDGKSWRTLRGNFFPDALGNEASIAFGDDHTAYCLLRGNPNSKMLGVSKGPYYQEWTWQDTRVDWDGSGNLRPSKDVVRSLGGPKIIRLSDGRLLGTGRSSGIALFWIDPATTILTRFATVVGTTYAGIVEHEGAIWVTCGDSSAAGIYLTKVKIPPTSGK